MNRLIICLCAFVPLCLASCSFVPTPNGDHAILLGGKGHLEYGPGGLMAYTYSNEKSFQHATQAITTVAGTWAMATVSKAQEATTQAANANASAQVINAQNQTTAQAALAAKEGVTKAALPLAEKVIVNPITPP